MKQKSIAYMGIGRKYPSLKSEGEGFRAGEVLEMIVNPSKRKVEWRVDGNIRATQFSHLIKEENRYFVPFMEMANSGDMIEWIS